MTEEKASELVMGFYQSILDWYHYQDRYNIGRKITDYDAMQLAVRNLGKYRRELIASLVTTMNTEKATRYLKKLVELGRNLGRGRISDPGDVDEIKSIQNKLLVALTKNEYEPGKLITKSVCPCCGAILTIEHGEDEGDIIVYGEKNEGRKSK